ncbi:MAG: DHH family phosphoesterase [Patescibacteria group bacterium]|nr:DHH family phosphoesterase [Patescibacteria group bacterium]
MLNNNSNDQTISRIVEVINRYSTGIIALPTNPSFDAVTSGLSLYLSLISLGKTCAIVCDSPVKFDLVGVDKIQNSLSVNGDNLVISFPYTDGAIDLINHNISGNYFNLIIIPRPGYPKLDPSQVKYSYSGGKFDFIITIDAPSLNSLGEIYLNNQNQFQGKEIINIDRHLTNTSYGTINFVNKTAASLSELVFKILQNLRINFDKDIATNLYAGLSASTNNFTAYSVTAETFETAAQLLRLGAIKKIFKSPATGAFFPKTTEFSQQPKTFFSQKSPEIQKIKPIEEIEKENKDKAAATPSEWLKPKIFKGSGLI